MRFQTSTRSLEPWYFSTEKTTKKDTIFTVADNSTWSYLFSALPTSTEANYADVRPKNYSLIQISSLRMLKRSLTRLPISFQTRFQIKLASKNNLIQRNQTKKKT